MLSESLYAARVGVETGVWRFGGLAGVTPAHGTIDFDASRPGYTTDTERVFWAASVEYLGFAAHRPFLYFVQQDDENETVLPGGGRFGYDSWYVAAGSTGQIHTGQWLYRVEFIYEGGRSVSDLLGVFPQSVDDVAAWAGRLQLIYMPASRRDPLRLRFEFELLLGSGDTDRTHPSQTSGGNLAGTDDESFNAFGYAATGLALAPELSNLVAVRVGASAFPFPGKARDLRLAIDAYLFRKLDDAAPISVTSDAGQGDVGFELDILVDWKIASDVALDLRYGLFFPGDAIPDSDTLHFFFVGISYGF